MRGEVLLKFELWGHEFTEEVQVLRNIPEKLLIGRKFWRKHSLRLDLAANCGSILIQDVWLTGRISKGGSCSYRENVCKMFEGADVHRYLKRESDYTEFSEDPHMQQKLRDLL